MACTNWGYTQELTCNKDTASMMNDLRPDNRKAPNATNSKTSKLEFLYLKMVLLIAALMVMLSAGPAQAEQMQIGDLAGTVFSQGGGAFLPPQVLLGLRNGQVSPIMQFVTMNQMLNQCVAETLSPRIAPNLRDPYLVAKKKFECGLCRIKKCWQNGMLIQMLPLLAEESGDAEQAGNEQLAALLATAFQKDAACDGSGGGGFDPNLIQLLTQNR